MLYIFIPLPVVCRIGPGWRGIQSYFFAEQNWLYQANYLQIIFNRGSVSEFLYASHCRYLCESLNFRRRTFASTESFKNLFRQIFNTVQSKFWKKNTRRRIDVVNYSASENFKRKMFTIAFMFRRLIFISIRIQVIGTEKKIPCERHTQLFSWVATSAMLKGSRTWWEFSSNTWEN